jgi:hypothetical protein
VLYIKACWPSLCFDDPLPSSPIITVTFPDIWQQAPYLQWMPAPVTSESLAELSRTPTRHALTCRTPIHRTVNRLLHPTIPNNNKVLGT